MRANMATTTSPIDYAGHHEAPEAAAPRKGFLARFFERLAEARMNQARVRVQGYLAGLSDARLADLGFGPDETKALRAKGRVPASYWG
jgi:hypothetical protein